MDHPASTSRNDRDMVTTRGQAVRQNSSCQPLVYLWATGVFVTTVVMIFVKIGFVGRLLFGVLLGPTLLFVFCRWRQNRPLPGQLTGTEHQARVATLGDTAGRRTLLHYFVAPPDHKKPAGRRSLERGPSESNATADLGGDRLDEEGADGSCIVCFGDFTSGERLCRLPCLHLYHAKCIDEWLDGPNHHWCPLCKTSVFVSAGAIPPATCGGTTPTTNTSNTTPINTNSNPQGSHDVV